MHGLAALEYSKTQSPKEVVSCDVHIHVIMEHLIHRPEENMNNLKEK